MADTSIRRIQQRLLLFPTENPLVSHMPDLAVCSQRIRKGTYACAHCDNSNTIPTRSNWCRQLNRLQCLWLEGNAHSLVPMLRRHAAVLSRWTSRAVYC